jgi:hypothetical protein
MQRQQVHTLPVIESEYDYGYGFSVGQRFSIHKCSAGSYRHRDGDDDYRYTRARPRTTNKVQPTSLAETYRGISTYEHCT